MVTALFFIFLVFIIVIVLTIVFVFKLKKVKNKKNPAQYISDKSYNLTNYDNTNINDDLKIYFPQFATREQQFEHFYNRQLFKEKYKDNPWVKIYYKLISDLAAEGAIIDKYNEIIIKDHYVNVRNEVGQWTYCRHHIDEIMISGAIYKELEEYKYGKSILINYDQHLLLHYIIVMANTTFPYDGMVVGLKYYFNDYAESVEYWDKVVSKISSKYNVPYEPGWHKYRFFWQERLSQYGL